MKILLILIKSVYIQRVIVEKNKNETNRMQDRNKIESGAREDEEGRILASLTTYKHI